MKDYVSLDIAKKLKEAGWKQITTTKSFYWLVYKDGRNSLEYLWPTWAVADLKEYFYAPTSGELLEALPVERENRRGLLAPLILERGTVVGGWFACYHDDIGVSSDEPADALALLLLELVKKGIVKL